MGLAQTTLLSCEHDEEDLHRLADGELDDGLDRVGQTAAALRGQIAQCRSCQRRWQRLISLRRLLVAASLTERGAFEAADAALGEWAAPWPDGAGEG